MTQHRVYRTEFAAYAVWTGIFSLPLLALAQVLRTLGWEGFLARDMLLPLLLCVGLVVGHFVSDLCLSLASLQTGQSLSVTNVGRAHGGGGGSGGCCVRFNSLLRTNRLCVCKL